MTDGTSHGSNSTGGWAYRSMSVLGFANAVLRNRKIVTIVTTLAVLVVAGRTIAKPRTYTVTTSFMPAAARSGGSPLTGLAAQFGVSLGSSEPGESPDFYVALVRSREILHQVVDASYPLDGGTPDRTGTLADVYELSASTLAQRHETALGRVTSQVRPENDLRTGVVRVRVTTQSPVMSRLIAEEILKQIVRFNRDRRRSRAQVEREFTEQQMNAAAAELRAAEARQRQFLEGNRDTRAPALTIESDRLMREVAMRQQIYTSLALSFEHARIEEVRVSPVVTVVEVAETPLKPDARGLIINTMLALVLGLALGIVLALLADYVYAQKAEDGDEIREFNMLASQARQGLRGLLGFAARPARSP